jgi:hypothetical protein
VDQMCATYDVSRNSRRWSLTVLFAPLNVAGINAQVIFSTNVDSQSQVRRKFLKSLAEDLVLRRSVRATCSHVPKKLVTKTTLNCTSPAPLAITDS